ncbi:Di-copper centre-containing protein [Thozetella sp. PMI_491]|nr:Di-copper centre-containing protein [Thozetella sp. PMI_491]
MQNFPIVPTLSAWLTALLFLCGIQAKTLCTPGNVAVRKEWGSLTKSQRSDYIGAVLCMQKLPSIYNLPGTKSRYDDFGATHVNLTTSIHLDGIFFHWHREFVYLWETALRTECGYKGYQPYWDWLRWPELAKSPLFDGSETSLSGNGEYIPNRDPYAGFDNIPLPIGTGGGCVVDGPFVNMTVNLGPFDFGLIYTGLPANWTAYNPRCLIRDLNDYGMQRFNNHSVIEELLAQEDMGSFQYYMSQGNIMGPHAGGHYALGYALYDFFASPLDPAFFLHHGQVDRMWLLWQEKKPATRWYALNGTSTVFNGNSTPEVTLDTEITFGLLGKTRTLKEVANPRAGHYCYRYE